MKITLLTGRTFDIAKETGINLKVMESAHARKLSLRIDTKSLIPVLTVPRGLNHKKALDFIQKQRQWIEEQLKKIPPRREFADGDKIAINGTELEIKHSPELRCGVIIEDGFLKVSGEKTFLPRRVRDFIKEQAQKTLYELSIQKAIQIGCKVNRVVVKDTKSRWGSCSTLHNINYNWRIIMAPCNVIDYLVAHEVAHLKHPNHSEQFWQCTRKLAADMDSGRKWLRENGRSLNEYI